MPRERRRLPVRYRRAACDKFHPAFTFNMSPHCMFVATSQKLEVGQHLELAIELPDRPPIVLRGEVRWNRQVPVAFRSVEPPGFELLITQAPESWYRYFLDAMGMA